ncbi:MAG: ferritin family protein [Candidatus Nanoarchaeia archaeon]|jgi:rubrerythrin
MPDKKLMGFLNKAQDLETKRFKNYSESAKKVINPEGKEVLLFLAKAEKRHLAILKQQLKLLEKSDKIDLSLIGNAPVFEGNARDGVGNTANSVQGDINIIKKAVNAEEYDVPFYHALLGKTDNANAKKLFKILMAEEKTHLIILRKKLRFMEEIQVSMSRRFRPRILLKDLFKAFGKS